MRQACQARWSGNDIVVRLNHQDVDRIGGHLIRRVIFVERRSPSSATDHAFAILELIDELILFPAHSGFAGLVHFERQPFWALRPCVYWANMHACASLPSRCLSSRWLLRRGTPLYMRLPKAELQPIIDQWELVGPQTWTERRQRRIDGKHSFAGDATPAEIPYLARKRA